MLRARADSKEIEDQEYSEFVWGVMGQSLVMFFACVGAGTAAGSRMFNASKAYKELAKILENEALPQHIKNQAGAQTLTLATKAFGYSIVVCTASAAISTTYLSYRLQVSDFKEFGSALRRATPSLFGKIGNYAEPAAKFVKDYVEDMDSVKQLKEDIAVPIDGTIDELKQLFMELNLPHPANSSQEAQTVPTAGDKKQQQEDQDFAAVAALLKAEMEIEKRKNQLLAKIEAQRKERK
eukprot:TRINITY_DN6248_c0_g1_i1.p1 TRINITY_DN6248_c0_g1~~TRINITY_DN6248_c0_g1_i1.p1  ORF type:complete len:238 (+),score=84.12 TRINITY_DN6248_c0_g1_i1:33-746(+)